MATGAINASKLLTRQGLDPHMIYEGIVVDNDDPRKLFRVRVRIPKLFDNIEDSDIPWAIPLFNHVGGAFSQGRVRSGVAWAPKVGHKVGLRFPLRDPHKPQWTTYPTDEQVSIPAAQTNYPDRVVMHMANGMYIIVDTRTNEIFFNNTGDMNITILGDVNQYIVGNQNLTVTNNKNDIAGYLLNAPDTVLKNFNARPSKKIAFPGLLSKGSAGNQHTTITGDQTVLVKGNRKVVVKGNDTLEVGKSKLEKIAQTNRLQCQRSETNG